MEFKAIDGLVPRVHPHAAAVSRIAFDARFQQWLAGAFGQPQLKVQRRLLPDESTLLEVEAGEGRLHLALDAQQWPALDMALALRSESDACAVATSLLAPWLHPLADALSAPRVVRRRRNVDTRRADTCAQVTTPAGSLGLLRMDDSLHEHLRHGVSSMPVDPLHTLGSLKLRACLVLLRRELPREVLAGLAAGDIVLLDGTQPFPTFTLIFGKGIAMQAHAHYDPHADQATLADGPAMTHHGDGAAAEGFNDLQLPVSFEVDTARISLAELASMRPGYVIELERPLKSAVIRLVCQGQTVGQGSLVAVGEQLGIRIARMGADTGAQ